MDAAFALDLRRYGPDRVATPPSRQAARKYCRVLATRHYENFTVASVFLPRGLLRHFHAVYAYCRWADDLADEIDGPGESRRLLAWWREQLLMAFDGRASHPVMVALSETVREFHIPPEPFLDLLVAFEQDQEVKRYDTFEQLLGYCRNSANPVGRLVLYLCRCHDSANAVLSDQICTGLQLANFWQDVARDFDIGRIYLPAEDRLRFGVFDDQLASRQFSPAFAELMRFEVARARGFFARGADLLHRIPPPLRIEVELFHRGGLAILRKIEANGYDVLTSRPELTKGEKALLVAGAFCRSLQSCVPSRTRQPSLNASYDYCERLARSKARNFYPAFRFLSKPRRRAMCALYAFMRITDDIADEPGETATKAARLREWQDRLRKALAGDDSHPIHPALRDAARQFDIPADYLEGAIRGVAMDLEPKPFATFAELSDYCYWVASVVGLCCLRIWGARDPRAEEPAVHAGIAFQLTNILRDLAEDAERGRVYLPADDMERYRYTAADLARNTRDDRFLALMSFEADRAEGHYEEARKLLPLLEPEGRAVFSVMMATYRRLLEEIRASGFDVFHRRIRVSRLSKLRYVAVALPTRWGWA